jgi:prepilin-type N-terminal cleavage/methylation domain-containing protein
MLRQRGLTLIEILVALALLGVIVVAIISAFSSTVLATNRHRELTNLDLLTRSDAEYIKSQLYSAKPANYQNITASGYTFSYQVLYWDPNSGTFATTNGENGLQEIVLTVTAPSGVQEKLDFLTVQG